MITGCVYAAFLYVGRARSLSGIHRPDFIDRQTRGPYSLWIHEHTFKEHEGGTLVGDKVEYAAPGGKLVQKFFVAPDLDRVFKYRHEVLKALFNPNRLTPEVPTGKQLS